MTVQQTVAIPADRRIHLDLTLPETFAPGSILRLEISSDIIGANNNAAASRNTPAGGPLPKNKAAMRAAIEGLCGLYEGMEAPGAYLERHHADTMLELEIEERQKKERE
jgi:hypothetical protein